MPDLTDPLPEDRRRALFALLVEVQDKGLAVPASRAAVADRFGVAVRDVVRVEREGLAAGWPPL